MAATHYQLVFEGNVQPGHEVGAVRNTLIDLFELNADHQSRLFAGEVIVLGRGMDSATANTFQQVLAASGAVSRVLEDSASAGADIARVSRSVERRLEAKRRAHARSGAILPDRRGGNDRRS